MTKINFNKSNMLLYAITPSTNGKISLTDKIEQALKGGITLLQLREKHLDEQSLISEGKRLIELCHSYSIPLIINDNIKAAAKVGADGVHLGQDDMPPAQARRLLGEDAIIGVSAHNVAEALKAQADGASYLGVGAAFATDTKTNAKPIAHSEIAKITSAVNIPVCVIGGITAENMPELSGCGADGVALVSAIFSADNIEQKCRELKKLSENIFCG